jgi:flagellar basal body-associated protein FliL
MAGKEKEAGKPEAAAAEGAAPEKKKGLPMKAIIVAVAVVVLEAATVGVTMMMSGGPKKVVADTPASAPAEEKKEKEAEVKLMDGRLPNKKMGSGRLYLFDISVVAKVNDKDKEHIKALIEEKDAEIKDRIRTIVASSGAEALDEPGLETLRRQIKYQLEHDLGKDTIKEILIPKCIPNRQD